MIVDAHTHIWNPDQTFPNPSATIVSPLSPVPLSLLRDTMDEEGVDRAVLVQPVYPGDDNSLVADAAAGDRDRFAAVAVVDPRKPDAPDRLEYWVRERGCRGLRLRPAIAGEEEVFCQESTEPLWDRIHSLGIAVNLLARPAHVPGIGALASRYAEVPVIVDHLAHPNVSEGIRADGFRALLDLAAISNVLLKPTGFYYYSGREYPYDDCAEALKAVITEFGARRLIWGSDFPHVLLKTGYRRSLRFLERECPYLSKQDRDLVLGENALRLYWT